MSVHVVIDGYNIIRQSSTLSLVEHRSLEEGREALLERAASYRKIKRHPVTVVFDGACADVCLERRTRRKGVSVVFSPPGESADAVIKRIVAREGERSVVVTSDRDLALFAAHHGAATVASEAFEQKMKMAARCDENEPDGEEEAPGWIPTTRKKGPARRTSKRDRKRRVRTRKL